MPTLNTRLRASLLALAALTTACGSATTTHAPPATQRQEPAAIREARAEARVAATPQPIDEAPPDTQDPPVVFTSVAFELRYVTSGAGQFDFDVASTSIHQQRVGLVNRIHRVAGNPEPRFYLQAGARVFRVGFRGPPEQALAQCQRVIDEVTLPTPDVSSAEAVLQSTATPCALAGPEA